MGNGKGLQYRSLLMAQFVQPPILLHQKVDGTVIRRKGHFIQILDDKYPPEISVLLDPIGLELITAHRLLV
jgi:hypothetical protein